jgi:hypothetical protein
MNVYRSLTTVQMDAKYVELNYTGGKWYPRILHNDQESNWKP